MNLAIFYSLIAISGLYFWIVMGGMFIGILFCDTHNRPGAFTTVILAMLAILEFGTNIHPITFIFHDPITAALYVSGYVAIGIIYIFLKWTSFVYSFRSKFDDIKQKLLDQIVEYERNYSANCKPSKGMSPGWLNSESINNIGDKDWKASFLDLSEIGTMRLYEKASCELKVNRVPLQVRDYKFRLYMWWAAWPLSMIWTIINDPIRRFANWIWKLIYETTHDTLQRISTNAFKIN